MTSAMHACPVVCGAGPAGRRRAAAAAGGGGAGVPCWTHHHPLHRGQVRAAWGCLAGAAGRRCLGLGLVHAAGAGAGEAGAPPACDCACCISGSPQAAQPHVSPSPFLYPLQLRPEGPAASPGARRLHVSRPPARLADLWRGAPPHRAPFVCQPSAAQPLPACPSGAHPHAPHLPHSLHSNSATPSRFRRARRRPAGAPSSRRCCTAATCGAAGR